MAKARKHHFIPRCLLRGFAVPETDKGRLFILDRTRKDVFPSSPANCGHRHDYNRLEPGAHPEPLVVEDFYAQVESRAAPVLQQMRVEKQMPNRADAAKVLDLVAIQLSRTPRFRRWLEGKFCEEFEKKIMEMGHNKPSLRRFAERQRKFGLPEDCWTPEGFVSRMKSDEFCITSDDNWKMAVTMSYLPIFVKILQMRHWIMIKFPTTYDGLILSDTGVGLLPIGKPGPKIVGLALPSTIIYMPISSRLVLVGFFPQARRTVEEAVRPLILNTTSFGFCLDQCFSSQGDFVIDDPDRGLTPWTTYQSEGEFPTFLDDPGDVADIYAGTS